jgi:ribonuclease P/MRP protein subunit POP5
MVELATVDLINHHRIHFFFLGSIRACKKAALECDEAKFEQYKVAAGDHITADIIKSVESCFEKIRGLES